VVAPFGPWRRLKADDAAADDAAEPVPGTTEYAAFPHLLLQAQLFLACTRAGIPWPHALATDLWLLGVLVGADGVKHYPSDDPRGALDMDLPSDPDDVEPVSQAQLASLGLMPMMPENIAELLGEGRGAPAPE